MGKMREISFVLVTVVILNLDWIGFYLKYVNESSQSSLGIDQYDESMVLTQTVKRSRPQAILCFFVGDEGSTVLSEAFKFHPKVYSPEWHAEPVNVRQWKQGETATQLDAIRFLLRLPSKTTHYNLDVKWDRGISEERYKKWVGNSTHTYMKASLCRNESISVEKWLPCMENVMSDLMCGDDADTIDHLILPLRYGFDRVCSLFVHSRKDVYQHVSQFSDPNGKSTENITLAITKLLAKQYKNKQVRYVEEFIRLARLVGGTCPNGQSHRTKVHVYDYDAAKETGMEVAIKKVFQDVGLHDANSINLGRFGDRKPSNYCDRIFDDESRHLLSQKKEEYEDWLQTTCNDSHPWCSPRIQG